jgi:deoxycytidylate deaminase
MKNIINQIFNKNLEKSNEEIFIKKKIHKFDNFIIKYALTIAEKSDMKNKHGCVIIDKKGSIISAEYNKMIYIKNISEFHNRFRKGMKMSIHAEENALRNVDKKKLDGAKMYVVRRGYGEFINENGNTIKNPICMNSKPCERCTTIINMFMKKHGLKIVLYSTE